MAGRGARCRGVSAGGAVIGWGRGQAEWGPRALGSPALADAMNPAIKGSSTNASSSALFFGSDCAGRRGEAAGQYFDFEPNLAAGAGILHAGGVRSAPRKIPHPGDHACRRVGAVQIVHVGLQSDIHALLAALPERRVGVPIPG